MGELGLHRVAAAERVVPLEAERRLQRKRGRFDFQGERRPHHPLRRLLRGRSVGGGGALLNLTQRLLPVSLHTTQCSPVAASRSRCVLNVLGLPLDSTKSFRNCASSVWTCEGWIFSHMTILQLPSPSAGARVHRAFSALLKNCRKSSCSRFIFLGNSE